MNTRLLIASAALVLAAGANAQTTQRFTASKANEYGLTYSLPATVLNITVETEHTATTPGEFYNYARRHLAINDAVTAPSSTVKVKSVTVTTSGVADNSNRWMVQFKNGAPLYMLLTDDGTPLTLNTEQLAADDAPELPVAVARRPTILETDAAHQAMTQDMIRSSSTSKRAELAAQRIFELRDMRSDLLSGQLDNPPADGQAMQLMLDNIANQEAALTAMFSGTTSSWTEVKTITLRPDTTDIDNMVIARISPVDGIIDADNLAGAPLSLSLTVTERGTLPVTERGEEKRFPKGGVAYTIPGTAHLSISFEGREIASTDVTLAQLGVTFGIDPALFTDKKAPARLIFDPATGAIRLFGPAE